jgi:hypothetical protein
MKRTHIGVIISFILLFLTAGILQANAQRPLKKRPRLSKTSYNGIDTVERKSVFISYPTNFFASTLKIGYEFKVGSGRSLALIGSLGGADSKDNSTFYGVSSFTELGLEAQFRIYILKDRPTLNGLYLAPYASYKSMSYSFLGQDPYTGNYTSIDRSVSNLGVGYIIGYQYIFSSSFTFNAFLGGGYNSVSGDNTYGTVNQNPFGYSKGITVHMGIGIGIAF